MSAQNRKWTWILLLVLIVAILMAGYLAKAMIKQHQLQAEETRMEKSVFVTPMNGKPAPDFTLTDQEGNPFTLSSLKGKTVVLQFLDPHCTDVCPIVSQETALANHKLGNLNQNVVFVGVNVNQFHEKTTDMQEYTNAHGLNKLPNWHYLTGTTKQLQAVWKAYNIQVIPSKTGDVQHSDDMYFIDSHGKLQYDGHPDNNKSKISDWAGGIAFYVKQTMKS